MVRVMSPGSHEAREGKAIAVSIPSAVVVNNHNPIIAQTLHFGVLQRKERHRARSLLNHKFLRCNSTKRNDCLAAHSVASTLGWKLRQQHHSLYLIFLLSRAHRQRSHQTRLDWSFARFLIDSSMVLTHSHYRMMSNSMTLVGKNILMKTL
jgi:hypothetical protein